MKLIILFNSFIKTSGGDIRFIQIMKRIKEYNKLIITSSLGGRYCKKKHIESNYYTISNEKKISNTLYIYLKRVIKSFFIKIPLESNDIIYSTSDFLPDTIFPFIKKSNNEIKWIQIIHHLYANPFSRKGNSFFNNLFGFLSQKISFFLIKRRADLIITVNLSVKEELINLGFEENKISLNGNGVDLDFLNSIQKSGKGYDLVFLGRLNGTKGLFDLLDILLIVKKNIPDIKLGIIGDGPKRLTNELLKNIDEKDLGKNVDLLGYLCDEEAFSIIKSSKIFISPSYEEGFGIAILEGMACGKPVIAWNLKPYENIFKKGLIPIQTGDVKEFAYEISNLLNNPNKLEKLSNEAIRQSLNYDWDIIAENELKLIEEVVK